MAVEEPAFHALVTDGDFEIREYPALVVAETTVTGDQREASYRGFRLLAGYIFGGNQRRAGPAMSTARTALGGGEKIAMTAPVAQTAEAGGWVVSFTMPRAYTLEQLPEPKDPRVRLRAVPPSRVAALRFSGLARPETVAAKTTQLRAWVAARRLRVTGPVTLAQYNPPWTPWFMRRNEVMAPVED